jgi:predicted transcriptional regulator
MVKKRQAITDEIARSMEDRAIGKPVADDVTDKITPETQRVTPDAQKKTKGYKNTIVSVRFDEGDYERLQSIAREQGTTAASLVRKAVKTIIRESDSP